MADRKAPALGRNNLQLDGSHVEADTNPDNNLSFEEALRELEEVVAALETGQVPLEQSITLLQRGMALADVCDNTLSRAESTLEQLIATADGELTTEPLDFEDEEDDGYADA